MRTTDVVEIHEKNCWKLTLYGDGSMRFESLYRNRVNQVHLISPDMALDEEAVPKYVYWMYIEMFVAHPEIFNPVNLEEELSWL